MLKHVLVPLDGSEVAERALTYIREIVDPNAGRITLLSVLDIPVEYPMLAYHPVAVAYEKDSEYVQAQAIPAANEYLNHVAESYRNMGYIVEVESVIGDPASVIVEYAEDREVDAIMMSTHGRTGISRWIFGSVAGKVLASTPCPVFIVPMRT